MPQDKKEAAARIREGLEKYKLKMAEIEARSFDAFKRGIARIDQRKLEDVRKKLSQ